MKEIIAALIILLFFVISYYTGRKIVGIDTPNGLMDEILRLGMGILVVLSIGLLLLFSYGGYNFILHHLK